MKLAKYRLSAEVFSSRLNTKIYSVLMQLANELGWHQHGIFVTYKAIRPLIKEQ